MDKIDKKYLGDGLFTVAILLLTVFAYIWLHDNPSVLFAGALAITFFVAANIVLSG